MSYDSTENTIRHIRKVRNILLKISQELTRRIEEHDRTKLEEPEKPIFDEYTPKLEESEYGSEEYETYLKEMEKALEHHYSEYRHHPEHFEDGIEDMHLLDLLEMVVDWTAAVDRHDDDHDIFDSIEHNSERFGYGEELKTIFDNTATWIQDLLSEEKS